MMFAVVMAGGQGTRFWPKSRKSKPKQFLDIIDSETMIWKTVNRLIPIVSKENIYVVINQSHLQEMRGQATLLEENIIVEPVGRNTGPCIGLAALHIQRKDPNGVMIVLPADHFIEDDESFQKTLFAAAEIASTHNYLISLGIEPKFPATGFGYIQKGESLGRKNSREFFKVRRFVEKPDQDTAKNFLKEGDYFWNSGIFVWKASSILSEIKEHLPSLYRGLMEIREAIGKDHETEVVSKIYSQIKSTSIDYGVMEKSSMTVVVPSDFGWNDVGSWSSLEEILPKDEHGNILRGKCLAIETSGAIVYGGEKLIVTIGLDDIVIVDTKDATLILKKEKCQDIRKVVERLEKNGMNEYL